MACFVDVFLLLMTILLDLLFLVRLFRMAGLTGRYDAGDHWKEKWKDLERNAKVASGMKLALGW